MRLIDADFVKQRIDETMSSDYVYSTKRIKNLIDESPTIEAEPIRMFGEVGKWLVHGKWIGKSIAGYSTVRCSVCGDVFSENNGKWNYCPDCGAKMDEVEE